MKENEINTEPSIIQTQTPLTAQECKNRRRVPIRNPQDAE
jgi:hypothetical protein